MFVPLTCEPSIKKIYGPSIINQLVGIQMALNKGFSQIYEHTERVSNPIKKISARSVGINPDTDLSKPGATVTVLGDDEGVSYVEAPTLSPEVYQINILAREFLEYISGIFEVIQGEGTSKARSGVGIERLQNAGLTRTNLRSIDNDQGLKTIARNVCSLFLDFVNTPRQFRFLDEDAQEEQYANFNAGAMIFPKRVERIKEIQQQIQMEKMKIQMAIEQGMSLDRAIEYEQYQMQVIEMLEEQVLQVQAMPAHDLVSLDVRIQAGSRSTTKQQHKSESIMLKELDVITDADLLKAMEYPNAHKIIANKAAEHKAQADAQAAAQEQLLEIEKQKLDAEHANTMELEELRGTLQLVIEKLEAATQIKVAGMRNTGGGD